MVIIKERRPFNFTFISGSVILALLLASCGGSSGNSTTGSQPATNPTPTPTPSAPLEQVSFTEIALSAGLDYVHGFQLNNPSAESVAGVAVGDYDGDGWLDLYIAQGDTGTNLLYRNLSQGGDYLFLDNANTAGVAMTVEDKTAGPAFADYDGDGDDDLFVGGIDSNPFRVFRNDGNGAFTEVTVETGLSSIIRMNNVSQAFGDYDLDGDLDLFIAHWRISIGQLPSGSSQHLWRNNGNGSFTDVSDETLIGGIVIDGTSDFTFTPNFADIDNDGDPDLLVVSDNVTSEVAINNGDQGGGLYTFRMETDENVITDRAGMGSSVADFDNDGDLDWFVTSISQPDNPRRDGNRFYENVGNGVFVDSTDSAGVRTGHWGWASCAADFNNDGLLDIFHVNGVSLLDDEFRNDPSRLFIANGDGSFSEDSVALGLVDTKQGRGVVCFDGDQDGDIDIFVSNNSDTPSLYRNDGGNSLNYLNIHLAGSAPNTAGIGARIYVDSNGVTQMREVSNGNNYVSQNPTEQHFGLGDVLVANSIRVVWPDRTESVRFDVTTNQRIEVSYPDTWSSD